MNKDAWENKLVPLMAARPDCGYGSLNALIGDAETYEDRIPAIATEVADALSSHQPATADLTATPHPGIADVLTRRIPQQPILGTLLYGFRTFGESRSHVSGKS